MNNHKLRVLAGLSTDGVPMEEAKKPAVEIDPALFAKKSKGMVKGLLKCCDLQAAIKAVKKQLKGEDVENAEELQKALDALTAMKLHEEMNYARKVAGLPLIAEKKDESDDEADDEANDEADDSDKSGEAEEEEEEDIPSIVKKMAAKLLKGGMPDEDKLADVLMKVYDAGVTDGKAQAESEEGGDKE